MPGHAGGIRGLGALLLLLAIMPLELEANRSREELIAARERVAQRMEIVPFKRIPDVITKRRDDRGRLVPDRKVKQVDLRLSILRPAGTHDGPPRPAVLFFHGGGFQSGSPAQFFVQAEMIVERGAVAFCVEYRLKDRVEVTIAQQLADARSALLWVRQNAAALQVDPRQVVMAGGSAGGYLSLASAVLPAPDPILVPDAVVVFNPAIDFDSFAERQGVRRLEESLGGSIDELSCTPNLRPGTPPILIFQGELDETTPLEVAEAFAERARELEVPCELVTFPRVGHGFHNRDPFIERCMTRAVSFLREHGIELTAAD